MHKIGFSLCGGMLCLALLASSQNTVVNRWVVAGQLKQGKVESINSKNREYEFLSTGKFNVYEMGKLKGKGTYTTAANKKTVMLNIDNESATLQVIKLTKTDFNFVADVFFAKGDTIVCYAANSPQGKAVGDKATVKAWDAVVKGWVDATTMYRRRADLLEQLGRGLEQNKGFDQSLVKSLLGARKKAVDIEVKPEALSTATVKQYQTIQSELTTSVRNVEAKIAANDELYQAKWLRDIQTQLEGLENKINVVKREYNVAVAGYNAAVKLKNLQKDIAFKADPGSDQAPKVQF